MRSKKVARGLALAAGALAVMTVASPPASASNVHTAIIDGESLPGGTHSVSVWYGNDARPSACFRNINGRPSNIDTRLHFASGVRVSFWAETETTCSSDRGENGIANVSVVLRDSDPYQYVVRFQPPR